MAEHDSRFDCPDCGPGELLTGCDGGSYVWLCAKCHTFVAATSWIAVGPGLSQEVEVYRLGDDSKPLLRGVGSAIWRRVQRLAGDLGETVIIRPVETGGPT
jgi:hypothetical protein